MDSLTSLSPATSFGKNWKLVLAYDGTGFSGWQVQPGLLTVQGELAGVLRQVTGETVLPQGSGRTDAGVHAEGQVVSFPLKAPVPPERLQRALNRRLPSSIRVVHAAHAPAGFHARANVLSKTYEYRIFQRRRLQSSEERVCPPAVSRYAWDCRWPLQIEAMQAAALHVVGTHDFTSFAAHDPDRTARMQSDLEDAPARTNVRSIFASSWSVEDDLLRYRVSGNGFLHHMVRNLVGTFVETGMGRRTASDIPAVLQRRDRRAAGLTAPPQGLFLMKVEYRGEQTTFDEEAETSRTHMVLL